MFEPLIRLMDCPARVSEGRLEVRDFVRGAPVVEFAMHASGQTGIVEASEEPMDILIFPHPPQGSPPLWQEPEREFAFDTELGALARIVFRTTGIEDNEEGDAAPATDLAPAAESAPAFEPAVEPVIDLLKKEEPQEGRIKAGRDKRRGQGRSSSRSPLSPRPLLPSLKRKHSRPPIVRRSPPVFQKPSFLRSAISRPTPAFEKKSEKQPEKAADKPVEQQLEKQPEKPAEKIPGVATKPLPVTLHGLAAGRGKPVQVFTAVVASGVDLQIPRSTALPLRPAMVMGPAPAAVKEAPKEERKERSVLIKPDPRKQRPDPRFGNGKNRKPEAEKVEADKKAPAVAAAPKATPVPPSPVVAGKPAPPPTKPEPVKVESTVSKAEPAAPKAEPTPLPRKEAAKENVTEKPAAPVPVPASTPAPMQYRPTDLGLPSLTLDASGSFWSKLPVAGKIGAWPPGRSRYRGHLLRHVER